MEENKAAPTAIKAEEVLTEVTTIAEQEEKSGQKVQMPSEEEFYSMAVSKFIQYKREFSQVFNALSVRGKTRVMHSVLDLPDHVDKVPVVLKEKAEKYAFAIGQNLINVRFAITQYQVAKARRAQLEKERQKIAEQAVAAKAEAEKTEQPDLLNKLDEQYKPVTTTETTNE